MSKITGLHGSTPATVIERLSDETGTIKSIFAIAFHMDGSISEHYSGDAKEGSLAGSIITLEAVRSASREPQ